MHIIGVVKLLCNCQLRVHTRTHTHTGEYKNYTEVEGWGRSLQSILIHAPVVVLKVATVP